tara:strand:- start:769 stop:915 length:147 start_codon:yes stop_codon:yes gene_type:complete
MIKYKDFCDDAEKMHDYHRLTKREFLKSYSYLSEEEYNLTRTKVKQHE